LHRFFSTGDATEISDSVVCFRSGWALAYDQEMLDSWVGFFVECPNNVSNYYVDGIQPKGVS
jgi:hypothetical protein